MQELALNAARFQYENFHFTLEGFEEDFVNDPDRYGWAGRIATATDGETPAYQQIARILSVGVHWPGSRDLFGILSGNPNILNIEPEYALELPGDFEFYAPS